MATPKSPLEARVQDAVEIVLDNAFKTFLDEDGRVSYGIPSQSKTGLYYRVNNDLCVCHDMRYRPWAPCKHVLAVRLHENLLKEQEAF